MTSTLTAFAPLPVQTINGHEIIICKNRATNVRYARMIKHSNRNIIRVPLDILGLAAGKDAWMRDVQFKCYDCRTPVAAKDAECQMCPACFEKAGEENAALDAGQ